MLSFTVRATVAQRERITMPEVLSELAPLLGANLIQHIAVLIAMAAVGVPVFAAARRMLSSGADASNARRHRMRDAVQLGLLVFVFLVLAVMGYLVFNLLAGRYSSSEDAAIISYHSPTEYRLFLQPRDPQLL